MRFQANLKPPPASDTEPRRLLFITTAETRANATALAARLRAEGFELIESTGEADEDPDEIAAILGDRPSLDLTHYDLLQIMAPGAPRDYFSLSICHGGAFVSAEADYLSESQPFWSVAMSIFTVLRDELGWVNDDQADLAREAAVHSVAADGTIARPAEITSTALDEAIADLLHNIPADYRLEREETSGVQALREAATELARGCPAPQAEFPILVEIGSRTAGFSGVDDELLSHLLFDMSPSSWWRQLGDTRTGRANSVLVHHDPADKPPYRLEPIFDRIPLVGDSSPYRWREPVHGMLRRAPEWQPYWLPEAAALMERAGYDLTVIRESDD